MYTNEQLLKGIKSVRELQFSYRKASRIFNIPLCTIYLNSKKENQIKLANSIGKVYLINFSGEHFYFETFLIFKTYIFLVFYVNFIPLLPPWGMRAKF